ncbi:MAG TPA: hypothetical protein VHH36_06320 [Candidatus Thermoplasmatota archaeon]|nr:hypothetical protein [Candidatus Thermoplasmatota archaeon]
MRERTLAGILVLLTLTPGALAHETTLPPTDPGSDEPADGRPLEGYTGPGREPYLSYFEGSWLYGSATATPLGNQSPRHARGFGDWLVWEDANRGDIYAFNVPAGSGFYVTTDAAPQRNPEVWGNVVVWEDYRHGRATIYAYFLETGETRRVSASPGNARNPSIHGDLVAWEDERDNTRDVYAARLDGSEVVVAASDDRESDPLVLNGVVYYRVLRFGVWDVHARDLAANSTYSVTSDAEINGAPFTNGRDVLYLRAFHTSWTLVRYDVRRAREIDTPATVADTSPLAVSGDRMLAMARDLGGYVQLVAHNLTSGAANHATGNLLLSADPVLLDDTAWLLVRTHAGVSLVGLDVSPFAFGQPPRITITTPGAVAPWLRPVTVQGILTAGPGWTEPASFTLRVDGGAPFIVEPGERWHFTIDPADFPDVYKPGSHRVEIRATFREGPPVRAGFTLIVPSAAETIDVDEEGPAFQAAKVAAAYDRYIGKNPASWAILLLLVVLVVFLVVRLVFKLRRRRPKTVAEFVPQE